MSGSLGSSATSGGGSETAVSSDATSVDVATDTAVSNDVAIELESGRVSSGGVTLPGSMTRKVGNQPHGSKSKTLTRLLFSKILRVFGRKERCSLLQWRDGPGSRLPSPCMTANPCGQILRGQISIHIERAHTDPTDGGPSEHRHMCPHGSTDSCALERNLLGPIEKFILDPLPQPLLTNCLDVGEIIAGQASAGW